MTKTKNITSLSTLDGNILQVLYPGFFQNSLPHAVNLRIEQKKRRPVYRTALAISLDM
jgi:hypothetical protein